jgi:very-short-patch-repair endonuclease
MNIQFRGTLARGCVVQHVPTADEDALWRILSSPRLRRWRFVRKYPVGPYLADFACRERNLLIEVEYGMALQRAIQDRARDEYLVHAGFSLFRVPLQDISERRHALCDSLLAILENRVEDFVEPRNIAGRRQP